MHSITRNGIKVCYRTEGERNKPALVMLHGFGNNSQNWYDLGYVDILKSHFFLVMPDVRGFGYSDKSREVSAYSLDNIVKFIESK